MNSLVFYLRAPFDYSMQETIKFIFIPKKSLLQLVKVIISLVISPVSLFLFGIAASIDGVRLSCSNVLFTKLDGACFKRVSGPLKIATWNVCMLFGGLPIPFGGMPVVSKRVVGVAQKIRESCSHIVCLQEVSPPAARSLWQLLNKFYRHGWVRFNPDPLLTLDSGIMILSKVPLNNMRVVKIPLAARMRRALVTFEVGNQKFGTTHLEPGDKPADKEMRAKQIDVIKKAELDVLLGDLNLSRGAEFDQSGLEKSFYDGLTGRYTTLDRLSIDYILAHDQREITLIHAEGLSDHHMLTAEF